MEKETPNKKNKRLQLDQTQVGLLFGFVSVGLLIAFGAGFISGMWYQTNEQMHSVDLAPTAKSTAGNASDPMTFYSTLTRSGSPSATPPDIDHNAPQQPAQQSQPQLPAKKADWLPRTIVERRYSIQVGSFHARDEAENLHSLLSNKGYRTAIKTALVPGKGILYRVRVGQFAEREAANRIAQRLRSEERLAVMITTVAP